MPTIKHESITNNFNYVAILNIIKIGTIPLSCHLDHFEHCVKKPIVEVSNKNGLKLTKCSVRTSK